MLQVLTFLRSDCELKIGDESASCFTVLLSQLEVVLKGNHTQIPQKYAHKLVSAYPQSVASGIMAVYNHWTGLVDWTGGLDWWTDIKIFNAF